MTTDHLSSRTREMLGRPIEERIAYIRKDSWIPYPRAKEILKQLEDLLVYPKCDRMPNMAISARTNNGKTRLIKHFLSQHPASDNPTGEEIQVPVLYIQCPGIPDESRLYDAILINLCRKFRPSASPREKLPIVLNVLSEIGLRMLVIDEANYTESGSIGKQKTFLNALRYLANELRISIVTLGTEEMMRVIRTVPAVENRSIPVFLQQWKCDEDFRKLLASFEKLIPLQHPSNLSSRGFSTLFHSRCEGTIGELKMLLATAAESAMGKSECLTEEIVNACGYMSPSLRKLQKVPI